MYATKAQLTRIFGVTRPTVCSRVAGIEAEIGKRYNKYAIIDNLISIAVYVDYEKYRKMLSDRRMRKYVPEFDKNEAERYLGEIRGSGSKENTKIAEITQTIEHKHINAVLIVSVDDKKMQKIVEYINKEIG